MQELAAGFSSHPFHATTVCETIDAVYVEPSLGIGPALFPVGDYLH